MNFDAPTLITKSNEIRNKGDSFVLNKLISPNEKPRGTEFKDRIAPMMISGLGTLAAELAASKYLVKIPKSLMIGMPISSAFFGYFYPEIYNAALKNKRGEIPDQAAKNIMNTFNSGANRIQERSFDVVDSIVKNAGLGKVMLKGFERLGGGGINVGKAIASGLKRTPKNAPWGEKAFGWATKGLALGAAAAGGATVAHKITAPRSQSNYNTFLRNNILAGNVSPEEVPISDAKYVNELGMR